MTIRVKTSIGRTYNAGAYESIRIDKGLEEDVEDGWDIAAAQHQLFLEALRQLNEDAAYLGLKKTGP